MSSTAIERSYQVLVKAVYILVQGLVVEKVGHCVNLYYALGLHCRRLQHAGPQAGNGAVAVLLYETASRVAQAVQGIRREDRRHWVTGRFEISLLGNRALASQLAEPSGGKPT